jgi:hypothetical protein
VFGGLSTITSKRSTVTKMSSVRRHKIGNQATDDSEDRASKKLGSIRNQVVAERCKAFAIKVPVHPALQW